MAVKKTPKKAAAKKAAKKAAPKKAAKKAAPKKKATPKKKAAPVKLTDKQKDLLKKVSEAPGGYYAAKGEGKALDSLQTKKLIKRGKKDKEKGHSYSVSKAGAKHLSTPSPAAPPA
jgi:adenylate kinase